MSRLELEEETPTRLSEPELHLADLWRVLVQHRWLVVGSVILCLATAWVAAFLTRPLFRATTLLALEQERDSPLDIAASVTRRGGSDAISVETESRLMKSRDVLERVVRKLDLAGPGPKQGTTNASVTPAAAPPSPDTDPVAGAAMGLQRSIDIRPVRGTNLIEVLVTAHSARKAADLANAVTEAYVAWKLDSRFRLLGQASQFLTSQIEDAKSALAQKEERLLAFSRRKDILSTDAQSNSAAAKIDALGRDLAAATADRISKEAHEEELRNAHLETLADSFSGGLVPQLRAEQARLEREYQAKLDVFKPDWPAMRQLKAQIEKGRQSLDLAVQEAARKAREAAHSDVLVAQRRESLLLSALQNQRAQAMSGNADAAEYSSLKVEADTQRALVDNILKRQAEIQVLTRVEGERVSNVRIVERALPPGSRFRPSYRLNGLVGLACGVLLGVGLAFAADYMDRSLRTPEQVGRFVKLPVLGIIPAADEALRGADAPPSSADTPARDRSWPKALRAKAPKAPVELLPHTLPHSTVAEAYRALRTSLLLSTADRPRSVVVTSAIPLEGKTTTATNLAVVLSQLGKKVLLVDADLHRSRLHEIFQVSNEVGLVSVLTGQSNPEAAVHGTEIPGLSVLPAGPTPPNPSGLLSSDRMSQFLEVALTKYDFVVFDSPPVLVLADAVLIGHLTAGVILAVKAGKTPREQVVRARDELRRGNGRILGVVLNALRDETGDITYRERYGARYYHGEADRPETAETPSAIKT
jgi:succinoglycan biosynthesis transport protein ExoP